MRRRANARGQGESCGGQSEAGRADATPAGHGGDADTLGRRARLCPLADRCGEGPPHPRASHAEGVEEAAASSRLAYGGRELRGREGEPANSSWPPRASPEEGSALAATPASRGRLDSQRVGTSSSSAVDRPCCSTSCLAPAAVDRPCSAAEQREDWEGREEYDAWGPQLLVGME
jgi:hypothetical protein